MSLKLTDTFKKINISDSVGVIADSVKSLTNLKAKSNESSENTENVIDSVDSLSSFLTSLQTDASPAVTMALQSQIQLLKYVQSPTMTLMVIDNLMVCLYKALKEVEDNQQKEKLRESFASQLQSFIFITEARLRYEIDNNKDEAIRLLADAGDMLMSSINSTAMMVVPMTGSVKIGHVLPKMVNVLAEQNAQRSFLGRLIMAKGKRTIIEEKKAEFDKTLNYIFDALDNYAELIGPSILLHGMLRRYADELLERYKISQYETVAKKIDEKEASRLETLADTTSQVLTTNDEATSIKLLFKAFSQIIQTRKVMDYDSVSNISRSLQSELEGYEAQIIQIDEYIAVTETELKATTLLQFGRKGELHTKIEQLKQQRLQLVQEVLNCRQRINIIGDILDPVNENIHQYEERLQRVVEKYKFTNKHQIV